MPSTYQRLQFLELAHREGRLDSLLFHPDGPRSLLPALPDMIALIEAASRVNLDDYSIATQDLHKALRALTEDRPVILALYVVVAVICWPVFAVALVQSMNGISAVDATDMVFGSLLGFLAALLWPLTLPGALMGWGLWSLYRRAHRETTP